MLVVLGKIRFGKFLIPVGVTLVITPFRFVKSKGPPFPDKSNEWGRLSGVRRPGVAADEVIEPEEEVVEPEEEVVG